jgi:hypothetical protein
MPPTDDATCIALWPQGLEIAARLGIEATTAQSWARRLQVRGLIQPRPRGGDYPRQRAKPRQDDPPASQVPPAVLLQAWLVI